MLIANEDIQFEAAVARLERAFPQLPAYDVRAAVDVAAAGFRDATVRTFVPILVERAAAAALRDIVAARTGGSADLVTEAGIEARELARSTS